MDKALPTAPAHKTWVTLMHDLIGRRRWTYTLFFGATAGMAVGVLNLVAVAQQWRKLEREFETFDRAIIIVMDRARGWSDGAEWTWVFHDAPSLLMIIGYWALIGIFLALVFRLARVSIIGGIARSKTWRWALFVAGFGGMLIVSGLRLLTWIYDWHELEVYFENINWPASLLQHAAVDWLGIVPGIPNFHTYLVAQICYWAIVGWFLGSCVCLILFIRKKKYAAEAGVSVRCLSKESEISP